jgi:N-acetylmuramoyl-L-alanine amidase
MLGAAVAAGVLFSPLAFSVPPVPPSPTQKVEVHPATAAVAQPGPVAAALTLVGHKVVIDPGHGGPDQGASTAHPPLLEKNLNLDIALRVRDLLKARGAEVVMTRSDDREVARDRATSRSSRPAPTSPTALVPTSS